MIEKLPTSAPFGVQNDWRDKINELVDAVNHIKEEYDIQIAELERRITALDDPTYHEPETPAENVQEDTESRPENVQDPTKWLGKLCKFWDGDEQISHLRWGILSTITPTSPVPFCCSLGDGKTFDYEHCEPVKPDSDIIYKGE